jgi:hypothetical protein
MELSMMTVYRSGLYLPVFFVHAALLLAPVAEAGPVGPQFSCGDIVNPKPTITASDALSILRAAVGLENHPLCAADTDGNGAIAASDALRTLRKAVGQSVAMICPFCCPLCDCTPQQITLALEDVDTCDECIPRVPASGTDIDSVLIDFAGDLNDEYQLTAVAECVWEATLPAAIVEKRLYSSGNSTCSGSPGTITTSNDVAIRVVRAGDGWETYVGQYAFTEGWGDVARAFVKSASCETGGNSANDNETCHLGELGNASDYDIHAINGQVDVTVTDPEPVCP